MADLTRRAVCPADPCAAVIGGVLVYRDDHHVTATYARTLTPWLAAELERAAGIAPGVLGPGRERGVTTEARRVTSRT